MRREGLHRPVVKLHVSNACCLEAGATPDNEGEGEGEGGHEGTPRHVHDEGLALSHLHELHSRLRRGGRHGLVHGTGSENTGDGLMRTTKSGEGTNGQRYFEGATEDGVVRAKKPKNAPRRLGAAAPERT